MWGLWVIVVGADLDDAFDLFVSVPAVSEEAPSVFGAGELDRAGSGREIGRGETFLQAATIKEGYVTRSATTSTNTAEVFFPQNPIKAIRLVTWDATSDTNNNTALTFLGGTMPITITGMINVTNLLCTSNTFVQTNAVAIIQRADDTIFSVSILGTNQTTNIIISATNSIPILTNDVLWVCTNISSTFINATNGVRVSG